MSFRLYNRDIAAFSKTDFRGDLAKINIPTLVIDDASDATVSFEYSGKLTHEALLLFLKD
ncbi:hypothetical protein COJ60_13810 [Bacillus cereus]|uniref:hypothetical protein n=1 Tax=Bacillus cereus group TaxID=86661 RepID=UPI000A4D6C3C|nr:hypothetical protein [Bacillus paranthracis]PFN35734.1 hypothetical protein COJ60_13810 [Bacillus cereus]